MKDLSIQILQANLDDPRVIQLIENHMMAARRQTAPGSAHALDLSGLRSPNVSVWVADRGEDIVGAGALKRFSEVEGEVKSMYTSPSARRFGVASMMLSHIINAARNRGLRRLSLETGSWPYFDPARALYSSFGFVECEPFGDYRKDPNSVFMTLNVGDSLPHISSRRPTEFPRMPIRLGCCSSTEVRMTTLIMLPGIGGSDEDHWQTLWERSHVSMKRFNPPDWDNPELSAWCKALQDAVDAAEHPIILVAHSLSCLLVAHWAMDSQSTVAGAFFVSVPDPEAPMFPLAASSFRDVPSTALPFRSTIIASVNDPYGSIAYMERRAREWNSELVNIGEHGHVNASNNLGEWNEGHRLLRNFVRDLGLGEF